MLRLRTSLFAQRAIRQYAQWRVQGNKKVLGFYDPDDAYGYMSNYYQKPVVVDGEMYPTVEHFFQSKVLAFVS
jgi:predicted NAD-dependent protein-ADP-ribosyltransferase YbiA (DUF1768 family)